MMQELPLDEQVSSDDETIRIGLVLSGGGALGIAHIGILEVIEEAGLRIDYITGTSMGSLIGGLYAIGYTTEQLVDIALSNNFTELFLDRRRRKYISSFEKLQDERTIVSFPIRESGIDLPLGIIKGQHIYNYLSELTWSVHSTEDFHSFPIPFAAIGTDIATGEAVTFRSGYLPDALRASISIPSVFAPHRIGDHLYVDGGLARNLPVQDAREMGADFIIAVDVGTPLKPADSLNTFSTILTQTLLYRVHDNVAHQKEFADYVINVERIHHLTSSDFDKAEELIELGRKEAKLHLDFFRELAVEQSTKPVKREKLEAPGKLEFSQIIIEGNTIYDTHFILELLDFRPFMIMGPNEIREKISKLYSSRYIDLVTYRIVEDEGSYSLLLSITENLLDSIKIGLQYESKTKASALLVGDFHNLIFNGSSTTAEVRLGDRMRFGLDHIYYGALGTRLGFLTSISYDSENVEWYLERERISRFSNRLLRTDLALGNYLGTRSLFAVGLRFESSSADDIINPDGIQSTASTHQAFFFNYVLDSFHRISYPVDGRRIVAQAVVSDPLFLSPRKFTSFTLYSDQWFKLTDYMSLNQKTWAGYSTGKDLPWNYWNVPNRYDPLFKTIPFAGVNRYQITSRNVQMLSLGVQLEPFHHRFAGIDLFAGRFMDNWDFDFSRESSDFGISLTLGALTIAGPVQLTLSRNSLSGTTSQLQIGYRF